MQTPTHAGDLPESKRLVPMKELERLIDKRKTWIFAELANPDSDLPRPVRCGGSRRNSWVLGEVLAYIDRCIETRDLASPPVKGCRGLQS
jgi:predicted DNA-binding transcriptional regulator AlpA